MKIGLLIIGNELLQGKTQDTNTYWLARHLRSFHIQLESSVMVSDDTPDIHRALTALYETCELVVTSGGVGPTLDDVTKTAIGTYFGKALKPSDLAKAVALQNYSRLGRELPEGHGYCFLPEGFLPLDNPAGFAPGLYFDDSERKILAAPGVPREFKAMLTAELPKLVKAKVGTEKRLINFKTRGIPEEKIFGTLCPNLWSELEKYGSVSSLPHLLGVDVGVALEDSPANLIRKEKEIDDFIMNSALAAYIWHKGFETLEEVIVQEAQAKNVRFAFAESCTGGLCSHRITNVSGSSHVFWGTVVSYDNTVKENILGVSSDILKRHGAVSEECAKAMAQGVRKALGVDVALSITGIAGPGGGTDEKPVGTVWMGVSTSEGIKTFHHLYPGDRELVKMRFSQMALYHLLDAVRAF